MDAEGTVFNARKTTKHFILIYGLTIVSCLVLNEFVKEFPIGPWRGEEIAANYWLDNVTWQIFAAWWACLFFCCGFFPFHRISSPLTRGVALVVASWALGWITGKLIYWAGPGAAGVFPLVGTTWFILALVCFAGGSWPVEKLSAGRQFLIVLLITAGATYLVTNSALVWIPPWWFPFLLLGLGTTTLTYLTRDLSKPTTGVTIILILFACVAVMTYISEALGVWDGSISPISAFWTMGHFTDDQMWLLWFFTATSVHYAMPTITQNYPFTRIPMPWGGLIACAFWLMVSISVALILRELIGIVFMDMNEALTYAYMGVNWSLVLPLVFGIGFEKEYEWATSEEQNRSVSEEAYATSAAVDR